MSLVGTFQKSAPFEFPLRKTDVHVDSVDEIAIVTTHQTYYNNSNKRVQTYYRFPLYRDASVHDFTIEFRDGKVVCMMQEAEEAKATYQKAVSEGKKAALMTENTKEDYDVTIGNVDPEETVIVTVKYLVHLLRDIDTDGRKFVLPTTITPRYDNRKINDKQEATWDGPTVRNPSSLYNRDASGKLFAGTEEVSHEEVRPQESSSQDHDTESDTIVYSTAAETSPLNIRIRCVETRGIDCVILSKWNGKIIRKDTKKETFTCELEGITLGEDFVMKIVPADDEDKVEKDIVWAEKYVEDSRDNGETSQPSFTLKICIDEKSMFRSVENGKYEFIFLIDRSGSMMGAQIDNARRALELLLNSLPMDCYFNIYGFGSTWRRFYRDSVKYSKETFNESKSMVKHIQADMGGTEMNAVLEAIFDSEKREGYDRKIMLLTDGEVWDLDSVFKIVEKDPSVQIFTIGVGNSVSHELVNGLAERTNGFCETIMDADLIEKKVLQQMQRAMYRKTTIEILGTKYDLRPGQETLHIVTDKLDEKDSYIEVSINDNEMSDVFAVKWTTAKEEPATYIDEVDTTEMGVFPESYPLRIQWVDKELRKMVKRLERLERLERLVNVNEQENESESKRLKDEIISMSIKYKVLCKYTSFVGVLETERTDVAEEIITTPLHPGKYAAHEDSIRNKGKFYSHVMQWGDSSGIKRRKVTPWSINGAAPAPPSAPPSAPSSARRTYDSSVANCGGSMMMSGGLGLCKSVNVGTTIYDSSARGTSYDESDDDMGIFDDYEPSSSLEATVEPSPRPSLKSDFIVVSDAFQKAIQFDGSVSWEILQKHLSNLPDKPEEDKIDPDTWATLLFLAYMTNMGKQEDVTWKMTIEKTMIWITNKHIATDTFKTVYEQALSATQKVKNTK